MKLFFIKFIILCVPLSLLVLLINIYIDSGDIYRDRSSDVAEIILSGQNAGIISIPNYWGRFQYEIVKQQINKNIKVPKDILVFGTSRSSEINNDFFSNKTFFNCVVPGGNVLDYIALYGLYKQHKLLPKYLIISIDPWTFHSLKNFSFNNQVCSVADTITPLRIYGGQMIDAFNYGMKCLGYSNKYYFPATSNHFFDSFNKVIGILSPGYFQTSLKSLTIKHIIATNRKYVEQYFIIRKDGSYTLIPISWIDSLSVKVNVEEYVSAAKGNFFIPADTNKIEFKYFENLLKAIKKDSIMPIVYFSPLNPIAYDGFVEFEKNDLETKIKEKCKLNEVFVLGSFNPHLYNINTSSNFFIDAYHPIDSIVHQVFKFHSSDLLKIGLNVN